MDIQCCILENLEFRFLLTTIYIIYFFKYYFYYSFYIRNIKYFSIYFLPLSYLMIMFFIVICSFMFFILLQVLGVYTFTKRCNVEEFETKQRKTVGYTTVTHFNVVHVDCHMSAVRLARARDEWESAALQNANTKCNGLLPLWGPQVPESAFASCLARHNTYLQECTSQRDISYSSTVHDLKLLLLRFAQEKSFHEDTGGGGPQSNMHIVPYLIHMALYVVNTWVYFW